MTTLLLHPDGGKLLLVSGELTADENCCCDIDYPFACDNEDGDCAPTSPATVTVAIPDCLDLTPWGGQTHTLNGSSLACAWSKTVFDPDSGLTLLLQLQGFCSTHRNDRLDPLDDTIDLSFTLSVGVLGGGASGSWNLSIPNPSPISWGEMCCNPAGSYPHIDFPGDGCNGTTATVS